MTISWWSNWGKCVDIYGPGDQQWIAINSIMQDGYGRDFGSTLISKAAGTSYATPKVSSITMIIMQAHLEITMGSYTGHYAEVDKCVKPSHAPDVFGANNVCGPMGNPDHSAYASATRLTASIRRQQYFQIRMDVHRTSSQ
jgi:hypothetical protein